MGYGGVMKTRGSKGTSLDEQSTQEINLEHQSTLPMIVERQDVEQQPTQSMAVGQKNPEHRSLRPRGKKQYRRSYRARLWWVSLLIFILLLISVLIGGSAIEGWLSHIFEYNESPTPVAHISHPLPTPTQSSLMDTTAKHFMDAMMRKEWASMWNMLSPDAQQLWRGEKDFIHFE
jgi:hypothetical protein